jgi:hypothetical protein
MDCRTPSFQIEDLNSLPSYGDTSCHDLESNSASQPPSTLKQMVKLNESIRYSNSISESSPHTIKTTGHHYFRKLRSPTTTLYTPQLNSLLSTRTSAITHDGSTNLHHQIQRKSPKEPASRRQLSTYTNNVHIISPKSTNFTRNHTIRND